MSERILEHLFDSAVKVKLLKLFVHNPTTVFTVGEIRRRTQASGRPMLRELGKLSAIGFVRIREARAGNRGKGRATARRVKAYVADPSFSLYPEIKNLVTKPWPASRDHLVGRLKTLGRVKLALLAGIFIGSETSRADMLIVGDQLRERRLRDFIASLEAEVGKELTCVALGTKDFQYRYSMFDRFVRDMLDYPHEALINKLKV
ncbi:hypothetical protein HY442_00050 [Candidatus Parcubacteria bacterium]|nr:hypothetical protein [Candidatus Parcubacteria bacterium]MBI4385613.1 hypothetical protein [Candidatus Parcubacteria bacterium]